MANPKRKRCSKCKKKFPATTEFFYREPRVKDGLRCECKSCCCVSDKTRYVANPEQKIASSKAWKAANPEKVAAHQNTWAAAHPEKVKKLHAAFHERHPLYFVWSDMIRRCYKPNCTLYPWYGALGVTVCARWLDPEHGYENFCEDMGPRLSKKYSLSRYLDLGNYEPGNVVWGTKADQAAERRGKNAMKRFHVYRVQQKVTRRKAA